MQKCGQQEITSINFSEESHLHWIDHFHKNPICFRIIADFEADIETDISNIGNNATKIYKQNPVLNGNYIVFELNVNLKSGFYESPLGNNNVDWFVEEVIKVEIKKSFCFKTDNQDIIMTQEDKEIFDKNNNFRFCEKEVNSDKIRDHCHLTGEYRVPAHNNCNNNVTQKQSNFFPFVFHNFSNCDCHLFFEILVDEKMIK